MNNKLIYAHDVINDMHQSGSANAGFNRRVSGYSYGEAFAYDSERHDRALHGGWELADRMIEQGKIYYVHNFHASHECPSGYAFHYGGSMVCNACQKQSLAKDWWAIKVFKDGNAWCCVGTGFENLQESSNYAFGDTREEAIKNYGDLMVVNPSAQSLAGEL